MVFYSTLNTNLTDPESRSSQWIFSAFPSQDDTFVGYPIVIITPIEVTDNSDGRTYGEDADLKKDVDVEMAIYAVKSAHIDLLADEIAADIRSAISTFKTNGLHKPMITDSETDTSLIGNDSVHMKRMNVNFQRW